MKRYAIVVENAGGNLAAYVPDLPGCIATADTPEELVRLIRAGIELHLVRTRRGRTADPRAVEPGRVHRGQRLTQATVPAGS